MRAWAWEEDPRHLLFTLARYKFVAKMLAGRSRVLEVGCADGWATRVVAQTVGAVVAVDIDASMIEDARTRPDPRIRYLLADVFGDRMPDGPFGGAYALDVIEHLPVADEQLFIDRLHASLGPHGVAIVGSPSLESQAHASPRSRAGHVNCKTQEDLRALLASRFPTVFMFSMNDEVVHTGFGQMAHYNMAVGVR